MEFYTTIEEF